ncbi:MAG TPA: hypothetical protein VJT50_08095 [Pyrinomonadaceae bacterium]|nr:hypothetical protein [Pyrinomonadaceae bacterium]
MFGLLMLTLAVCVAAQTGDTLRAAGGVLRIRARVKLGDETKGLSRKRFFLIKGSLEQNKALVEAIKNQPLTTRDCFYAHAGATPQLIAWLKENDCESVYCREIQADDVQGPKAVPEFATALAGGEKSWGNKDLARKWLTVNLPDQLRDGFYRQRQMEIANFIKRAEASSGAPVLSVMTDTKGTAYFTDLDVGSYTLTNIAGAEIGPASSVWNCDIQMKADDMSNEKAYMISNRKDKNVKCVAIEKPLPVCAP